MQVTHTKLDGVIELTPTRHGDDRGWFSEVWNRETLADHGIAIEWVQDNEAWSSTAGTLRGFHYQLEPRAQDKLIRVVSGRIVDVAVDLRRASATFGQHVAVELTSAIGNQLLVPKGFGHAYLTLEADCVIGYKVSDFYSPEHDRAVRWDDPTLGVEWPFSAEQITLSAKDRAAALLADAVARTDDLFD